MKRTLIALSAALILLGACKKNEEPEATCSDGIQNQSETGVDCGGPCSACTTPLCDGIGSTSFFPLAANNSWSYSGSSNSFTNTVTGTSTFNSVVYTKVESSLGGTLYLRIASNGDVMAYNTSTSSEVLFVPANPTNNQTWAYTLQFSATRKVIAASTTYTTSSCSYSGCVKIQNFNSSGTGTAVMYYKKGVGMISTDEIYPGVIVTKLNAVTLN